MVNRLNSEVASDKPTFQAFNKNYDKEVIGSWEAYINSLFCKNLLMGNFSKQD